jgi:hypothetical protein
MTDTIDTTRGTQLIPASTQDDLAQRQKSEKIKTQSADRVSLGELDNIGETYGPGLKVSSPYDLLRSLVIKTLQDQGINLQVSNGSVEIDFNTMTQEEAQNLVSEDGYFGVEKTSQRIVDFAINAFGQDPSKLEQMKDSIDKGFLEAQEAFGGSLPEISQHTYDAIMEKLDAFAAQFEAGE